MDTAADQVRDEPGQQPAEPVVRATGLGVRGPQGWVFTGVDLEIQPRQVLVIEGPAGSGRTSLLLCLTGRMHASTGELTVAGLSLPAQARQARRRTGVARIAEQVVLEPGLTIDESVAERIVIDNLDRELAHQRFFVARELVGLTAPDAALVKRLAALDRTRLTVALALLADVAVIVLDDADEDLHSHDEMALWALLRNVAAHGPAVVASTVDAGHAPADQVLRLGHPTPAEPMDQSDREEERQ